MNGTISNEEWDKFCLQYQDFMLATARRVLGNGGEAEDVVQESILAAMRTTDKSRQLRGGWFAHIVRCRAISYLRKYRRQAGLHRRAAAQEELENSQPLSAEKFLIGREGFIQLLSGMSDRDRRIVLLRLEGMSDREIAEQLDMVTATVGSRLSALRRKLESA